MYTPDELLLIRDLLTAKRKEAKTDSARTVVTNVIEKTDDMIRAQRSYPRRKAAA